MAQGRHRWIWILLGVIALLAAAVGGYGYYAVFSPNTVVCDGGLLYIHRGDSYEEVVRHLGDAGFVKNMTTFRLVAKLKKYPQSVRSGRFRIAAGMSNNDLIDHLRSGEQEAVDFTFNNLRTVEQLAGVVAKQLDIDSLAFMQTAGDTAMQRMLGFTPATFIGMFIPNTYEVYWNTTPELLLQRLEEEYRAFWNIRRTAAAKAIGLSTMDVMTLASIIEEETTIADEYPVIAGIYLNRLQKGIPLSACPTLKFALGDFTLRRILNVHKEVESPYNTYKYKGLPPGPIRMPSIQVIEGVLRCQKHDYLYMCAKSDFSGRHHFSKTLREHSEYAKRYHEALNRRKIY